MKSQREGQKFVASGAIVIEEDRANIFGPSNMRHFYVSEDPVLTYDAEGVITIRTRK